MDRYCPNFSGILCANDGANNLLVSRARCKQWNCPYCAVINANIWRARIIEHIKNHAKEQWFFVTLTASAMTRSLSQSAYTLRKAWDKLRKLIHKYKTVEKLHYVRIFEPHKDGAMHIHMMINVGFGKRWYKDKFAASGGGWNCDEKKLRGDPLPVATYMAKYMTKTEYTLPKYMRRVNCSVGWAKDPLPSSDYQWWMQDKVYAADVQAFESVYDIQRQCVINYDDFEDVDYYPPPSLLLSSS